MNLEFLKSKKNLIIIGILLIVIIVIIILSNSNKKEENVLLTCNKSNNLGDGLTANQSVTIIKTNSGIKLEQNMKLIASDSISEFSKQIFSTTINNIKNLYSDFLNSNYIDYKFNSDDKSADFNIIYNITEETNDFVIEQLRYDFLNNSVDNITNYFEEGGFVCQRK